MSGGATTRRHNGSGVQVDATRGRTLHASFEGILWLRVRIILRPSVVVRGGRQPTFAIVDAG
ncbi:MAG: hypothetical protein ACR2QQ_10155, partial [Gammaproteobacteria bacterium]